TPSECAVYHPPEQHIFAGLAWLGRLPVHASLTIRAPRALAQGACVMLHRTPRAPSVCRATVATALALSLSFPGVLSGGAVDPEATPQAPVRIGLVSSLFRDLPVKL